MKDKIQYTHFHRDIELIKEILCEVGLESYIEGLKIGRLQKYACNRNGNLRAYAVHKLYEILVVVKFLLDRKSCMIIYASMQLGKKIIDILCGKYSEINIINQIKQKE